jgi:hypothetical protein
MLAVFDALHELITGPDWHGCPFLSATGEARTDTTVKEVASITWDYTLACFVEDATALGVADPAELAERLVVVYEGAVVATQVKNDRAAAQRARSIAEMVIDAAV